MTRQFVGAATLKQWYVYSITDSGAACALAGTPSVTLVDASGTVLGSGEAIPSSDTDIPETTVYLSRGHSASFYVVQDCPADAMAAADGERSPVGAVHTSVTFGRASTPAIVPNTGGACVGEQLDVSAIGSGTVRPDGFDLAPPPTTGS